MRKAQPEPGRRLRIGIVGAGGVGTRHARVLGTFGDVAVTAIADAEPERAAALAGRTGTGARAYRSATEMAEHEPLDALYACVPPFAHGEPEAVAAELGLALFVEKPLAADWESAADIAALVRRAGLVTGTGYHWRCLDTVAEARHRLGEGTNGNVGLVAGRWLDTVPPPAWWARRAGSGGQLVEQATHVIDLARHLAGEVTQVFALGSRCGRCPDGDIDETSTAVLRFASGAVGSLAATCLCGRKQTAGLEVIGPETSLEITEDRLAVHEPGGTTVRTPQVDPRVAVDREFVDAALGRTAGTRVPYDEALRTHRVACALATSAATGQPVDLPG
jgi:predicted dehydrogenase